MRLTDRLARLENAINTAPMMTLDVHTTPTPEQQATIDHCIRTGRRLMVFIENGNTAWMPGCGAAPWEAEHASH